MDMHGPSFIERVMLASFYSKIETQPLERSYSDFAVPKEWEKKVASILDPIFSLFSSTYCEKKAILSNRLMMMEEAKQKFAHVQAAAAEVLQSKKMRPAAPEKEDRVSPKWLNQHPEISLSSLGLDVLIRSKFFFVRRVINSNA